MNPWNEALQHDLAGLPQRQRQGSTFRLGLAGPEVVR